MIPIHELLARKPSSPPFPPEWGKGGSSFPSPSGRGGRGEGCWDPEFGCGEFELAYLDKVEKRLLRVSLREAEVLPGHEFIRFTDAGGVAREVYLDGALIWSREALS